MTVEVYKGRLFRHGHERQALGRFLQQLVGRFGDSSELLYIVVIELDVNGAAIDLLLLSPRSIIIADLKELTAASREDCRSVHLEGKENGFWKYYVPGKTEPCQLGGKQNAEKNPYKQLSGMRFQLAEWLAPRLTAATARTWDKDGVLDVTSGWAAVSPGFDGSFDDLDLPWDDIQRRHNWFRVLCLDDMPWEFHCTTGLRFEFTERQMRFLVEELGASRVENMGEVLPEYFPRDLAPAPPSYLFTRIPNYSNLVGRAKEIGQIERWVEDTSTSIVSIKGMGGIGKTSVLGRVIRDLEDCGWRTRYAACREKAVTAETFLAAIAAEIQDRVLAHYVLDKENKLLDRLDAALDYLQRQKTLLVFDDFHKAPDAKGAAMILRRIVARSPELKAIISGREHPEVIDIPDLQPVTQEMVIDGLSMQDVSVLFGRPQEIDHEPSRLEWIYERTAGNPYAVGLLKPLVAKYGWNKAVGGLPLYQSDREQWFGSLIETLDKETLQLAHKVSAVRSSIGDDLISHLSHAPKEAARLAYELVDKFILQKTGSSGSYIMHDYIREYLYATFGDPKQREKAHLDAAKYYEKAIEATQNDYQTGDALYEAVYHYEKANQGGELLRLAEIAFVTLYKHGDWDRANEVSAAALKAARAQNRRLEVARWLVHTASWEFEHDRVREAGLHLQQAVSELPTPNSKLGAEDVRARLEIETNIYKEKGRIAYYVSEYDQAAEHLSQALKLAKGLDDEQLVSDCLMRIARLERQKGNFDGSRLHFEEARAIAEKNGDRQILVEAVSHLGLVARQEGDFERAQGLFEEAYRYARESGDWRGVDINKSLLADLLKRRGDYASAAAAFSERLAESRRVGNGLAVRITLGLLAECLIRMGSLDEGRECLDEVESRCNNTGDGVGLAMATYRRGLFVKKQGKISEGDALILNAIERLRELGSEVYIADMEKDLGPVQERLPGAG